MQKLKWSLGRHGAWYGERNGITFAVVYQRGEGWAWWDFMLAPANGTGFETADAAKRAAEEGNDER